MNQQKDVIAQQRESEWQERVSDRTSVNQVAAVADPQSQRAPGVKVWHGGKARPSGAIRGGHFAGAAVILSVRGGTDVFGPGSCAAIQLELTADPRIKGARVDSPPLPWLAHKVLCGGCGEHISVRGDRLLQGAIAALDAPGDRPLVHI